MEILLLGTGAAEGVPALLGETRVDRIARELGGREIRSRTGALIDGRLKIDFPPDTLSQAQRERIDAKDWTAVLFTHGDDDHFAPRELQYFLYPFTEMEYLDLTIFGNDKVCYRIRSLYPEWPMEVAQTQSFETFWHEDYEITPLQARHNGVEDCQNPLIKRDGKTLLYATDTGIWEDRTWHFLADYRIDGLVIECTEGLAENTYAGHLNLEECVGVVSRLRASGVLKAGAPVVTTHHSHNGDATYAELVEALKPHDMIAGYDGMRFTI